MRTLNFRPLWALPLLFAACSQTPETEPTAMSTLADNPLLKSSTLPFKAPHFDQIRDEHFRPAIEEGMKRHLAEIDAIANNVEAPTFENTIVALEKSGQDLNRASSVFYNLTGSATNDSLQAVKADLAPKLAAHGDAITLNAKLFQRISALHEQRASLGLDPVSARLLDRYYTRFVRAGALLDQAGQEQMKKLNEEEANLVTRFEDNILKEQLFVESKFLHLQMQTDHLKVYYLEFLICR